MNDYPKCSERCARMPLCLICHRSKAPSGRDTRDNGLCFVDCPGYHADPTPGHLWPEEWRDELSARAAKVTR